MSHCVKISLLHWALKVATRKGTRTTFPKERTAIKSSTRGFARIFGQLYHERQKSVSRHSHRAGESSSVSRVAHLSAALVQIVHPWGCRVSRALWNEVARRAVLFLLLGLPLYSLPASASADAEIVSVIGKGDKRASPQADWTPALPKHLVNPGGFVRTHEKSQMALLLPDRTQVRLNQNSQLQIKTLAEAAEWNQSVVRLNSGRAWSQARPPTVPAGKSSPPTRLTVETPSATLSIRGTDWEIDVAPDGRTQLVVLHGEIDMANDFGGLKVGPGQAAVAEIGKAPTRLLLASPAKRIQWVTAWTVQPRRWLGELPTSLTKAVTLLEARDFAAANTSLLEAPSSVSRDILLADLAVMQGDIPRAITLLIPHAMQGTRNVRAIALLAHVHLADGDADAASTLLSSAQQAFPKELELLLAEAELHLYRGEGIAARKALASALEINPGSADGWFLRGSMETERENIRAATDALARVLVAQPDRSRVHAERGTLETLSGEFAHAEKSFNDALAIAPDDYLALTGRGILSLKTGHPQAALEDFLRAGVIEPRFSRAWLYSAVAFYQLGEGARAEEALTRAATLDPRDPLPHVMQGLIEADRLHLGAAVGAAREAQARMPFLKSINQVLNNQKGSANIGSALSAFGMEEWARHYATSAYSPWWAGSHLFLADRQTAGFNKNSELFKGFITDPTVFGASQRASSLVPTPGHHGRTDLFLETADWSQSAMIGTANGLVTEPFPAAYFVSGDYSQGHSRLTRDRSEGANLTLGLGARPTSSLGLFMFGTATSLPGRLKNSTLPDDPLKIDQSRVDLGIDTQYDARNQVWIKAGSGRQSSLITGTVAIPAIVRLYQFHTTTTQSDFQFRHAMATDEGTWISWGYEAAHQDKAARFDVQATAATRLVIAEWNELLSKDAYLVIRAPLHFELTGEIGLFDQRANFKERSETRSNGAVVGTRVNRNRTLADTHWRGGMRWNYAPLSAMTWVAQQWRRPAGVASVAPIDTLGVAVNDSLTSSGGLYRRGRLQIDHEVSASTFLHGFLDQESFNNIASPSTAVVPDLQLTELDALRNRRDAFTVKPEFESSPQFLEGRAKSFGFAINSQVSAHQTLNLRYRRANAQQTGIRNGLAIPYLSRDYLRVSSQWVLPQRLLLSAFGTWRGLRYRNETNTFAQRIDPGWTFGFSAYWESADKRWVLQGILDNLRSNRKSSDDTANSLILRASYLF